MRARTAPIAALLLLLGCAGHDYRAPVAPAPASWQGAYGTAAGMGLARWWTCFHEAELDALIEQVLAANHDLRLATERVREARARLGVVEAGMGPAVDATTDGVRSRPTLHGPQGRMAGGVRNLYQAGFDASWELDLFGGIRRGIEAAAADGEALEEAGNDVRVSVVAETVRIWIEGRTAGARHAIARRLLSNAQRQSALIGKRRRAGLIDGRAVADAAAAVAQAEAALPPLASAMAQARHRLALLAGRTPDVDMGMTTGPALPATTDIFAMPLPAELVRRRPDLRRAERELAAATARIGVAEADLYPRISLTGAFGVQSISTGTIASADSTFWSVGPSIRWPVFSAGRIRNQVKATGSVAEQAAIRFEQAALRAYAEVEDALVGVANARVREDRCAQVVTERSRAMALQGDLRVAGLGDGLSVLRAEADHLQALDQMLAARGASGVDLAALAKALGGGWDGAGPETLASVPGRLP